MTVTDDNKLRSLAGILGVSSLAVLGVTACDDERTMEDGDSEDFAEDSEYGE